MRFDGTAAFGAHADIQKFMNSSTKILTTFEDIITDLRNLGVASGDLACLHVSLSALGFVPGGTRTVIEAVLYS